MFDCIQWIVENRKRLGIKQYQLGEAVGLDTTQMCRIESGGRRVQAHELVKFAAVFGVPVPPFGLEEDGASFDNQEADATLAPIYGVISDNAGGWLILRHEEPIDRKPRAPHFAKSAKVFGLYAPDDAMAPRFKPGEIAWVDPARPPKPGDEVALIGKAKGAGPERVLLAELRSLSPDRIVITQHKDQQEQAFDGRRWTALLVLPRY
jgi:transcriptional regulator with XRE-family HTH domain